MIIDSVSNWVERRVPGKYQNTAKQFVKFSVTGGIGAVVDFGTYNILTRGIDWTTTYEVLGQHIIAANMVSVFLAIVSNFFINKYWTFRDPSKKVAGQFAGYIGLNTVTWVLNQILTSFFAFNVVFLMDLFGGQTDNVAKALAIGIILFLNFFGSKLLIFRRKPKAPVPGDQVA